MSDSPIPSQVSQFFADMRERHAIFLRRKAGRPWPWTDDYVMQEYSITNPFRENDRTTRWLRDNVRERMRSTPEVLLAIAIFRWFNRTEVGESIFCQYVLGTGIKKVRTSFEMFLKTGDTNWLKGSITEYCGKGPYVTGSYIIQGWRGMNKLDGVLKCISFFNTSAENWKTQPPDRWLDRLTGPVTWRTVGEMLLDCRGEVCLEDVWLWLRQFPYLGDFMAHEIVQDLRYTDLLCDAPDIMTWSNPGPGAERGLARIYGRDIQGNMVSKTPKAQLIAEMRELLELSRSPEYWPQPMTGKTAEMVPSPWITRGYMIDNDPALGGLDAWPRLELHQIEMWLCEEQKLMKTRLGEGRPRGKYRHRG